MKVSECMKRGLIQQAVKLYEGGKFASSSAASRRSITAWWPARARVLGMAPYPISVAKLRTAGALLKYGGYRAAPTYLYAIKREHVKMHGEWTAGMELELKEGIRSCVRGIGPPSQCTALDLGRIAEASIPSATPSEGPVEVCPYLSRTLFWSHAGGRCVKLRPVQSG